MVCTFVFGVRVYGCARMRHLTIHSNQQKHLKSFWKIKHFYFISLNFMYQMASKWKITMRIYIILAYLILNGCLWVCLRVCMFLYAHVCVYSEYIYICKHILPVCTAAESTVWIYSICKNRSARLC